MFKPLYITLALAVLVMILTSGSMKAKPTSNVVLISHLFNSGGGPSTDSAQRIILMGALGQVTTGTATSTTYYLSSGLYPSLPLSPTANEDGPEPKRSEKIFLPLINR